MFLPATLTICLDPGHGMSNRKRLQYDTGAIGTLNGIKHEEASIALDYVNCLRDILRAAGHTVIRTRRDAQDPAPVERRDDIARAYKCDVMISIHCNSANGKASGTEVFYRGTDDLAKAKRLSALVANALALPDRGAKTEKQSQHKSLAVLEFDKCWLIELGFIDNPRDLAAMLTPARMQATCRAIAAEITKA
jgi:N-acetylmuramoyl-L-alanine amidase